MYESGYLATEPFSKKGKINTIFKNKREYAKENGGGQNPLRKINPIHLLTEKTKGANNEN
jgi:hypothetical protein